MTYYNDNEPFNVGWLKELIAEGLIPDGDAEFILAYKEVMVMR